ncbi:MAG: hypothetical protein IJY25_04650 [Bacilli bacterium]|nr:hypothetical protein [Bacilli bacterium]
MKKLFNILFITIVSLLVLPIMVRAEVKTFGDIQYTIETEDIKDYVCEEIKDHEIYLSEIYDVNKLLVYDVTDDKAYVIDLINLGVCTEFGGSYPDSGNITYIWGTNNDIYEAVYEENSNSSWYEIVALDTSYPFIRAEGQYDADADYYEINDDNEAILVKEEDKNEADFNAGNYYTILEPISKKLLSTFETTNFVAPKEKTGLDSDISYSKNNFLYPINFNNETYFVFVDFSTQYFAAFDKDGNYQTFGYDKLVLYYVIDSFEGDYVVLYTEQEEKVYASILDKDYNLVLSKELDDSMNLNFIGKNSSTDYLFEETDNDRSLISITKSTVKNENVPNIPNTYDGITTSIVIGIIALLGLGLSMLYIKRKKVN